MKKINIEYKSTLNFELCSICFYVENYNFISYVTYKNEESEEVSKRIKAETLQILVENTQKFIDLKTK